MVIGTGLYGKAALVGSAEIKRIRRGLAVNVDYFSNNRERAIQSFNRYMEDIVAATKKLKKDVGVKAVSRKEFEWKGFINVNLTGEQKESFKAWDIQDDDVWDGVAQYAAAGYKIQLSFNKQNDKFNCTGTGQPETNSNSGYAVSAFANTPYEAVRVWLFKVSVVLPDDWTEYQASEADDIG